jgi:DNA-binding MarR family transcriptional regulator
MHVTQKQVCADIVELLNLMKNAMLEIAEDLGVTRIQLFALYSIKARDGLVMGEVANVLHCDPSNVTGLVDRLVSQGLVVRQACPEDRRAKRLALTEKGSQIAAKLEAALPSRMGCDRLDGSELVALHNLILKVVGSSGHLGQPSHPRYQIAEDAALPAVQK